MRSLLISAAAIGGAFIVLLTALGGFMWVCAWLAEQLT